MGTPRIILAGDRVAALGHLPAAMNTLHKARAMNPGGSDITGLASRLGDSAHVEVLRISGHEVVRVFAAGPLPRLEPELRSTDLNVYSGAVRVGKQTGSKMDSFRPTQQAWQYAMGSDPTTPPSGFNQVTQLVVDGLPPVATASKLQYESVSSSMYSGLMAKAAQIILGFGDSSPDDFEDAITDDEVFEEIETEGVQIRHDFRFARTHGIVKSPAGQCWLVEVSVSNGVMAMPLLTVPTSATSVQDVLRRAHELFGGLPSPQVFPVGGALDDAIVSGDILRLIEPAGLDDFYSKELFSTVMGWCFNDSGTMADNVVHYMVGDRRRSAHMRITFVVGDLVTDRDPGDPIGSITASLSTVHDDWCYANGRYAAGPSRRQSLMRFYEPTSNSLIAFSTAGPFETAADSTHAQGRVHVWFDGDNSQYIRLESVKFDGGSGTSNALPRFLWSEDPDAPDPTSSTAPTYQRIDHNGLFQSTVPWLHYCVTQPPGSPTTVVIETPIGNEQVSADVFEYLTWTPQGLGLEHEGVIVPRGIRCGFLRMRHRRDAERRFTHYALPYLIENHEGVDSGSAHSNCIARPDFSSAGIGPAMGNEALNILLSNTYNQAVAYATVLQDANPDVTLPPSDSYEMRFVSPSYNEVYSTSGDGSTVEMWMVGQTNHKAEASYSTMGRQHVTFSRSPQPTAALRLSGPLLSTEGGSSRGPYSFLGYT